MLKMAAPQQAREQKYNAAQDGSKELELKRT